MNCPKCNVKMIWGNDIDVELDDEDNSCVCSHFICPDPECHTEVEVLCYEKPF